MPLKLSYRMAALVLVPTVLLFLFVAQAAPLDASQTNPRNGTQATTRIISLNIADPKRTIYSTFTLSQDLRVPILPRNITVQTGLDTIITEAKIESTQTSGDGDRLVLITSTVQFGALPGVASVRVSILDPGGFWTWTHHRFEVIGIALYQQDEDRTVFLRDSRSPLLLKRLDGGAIGATVKAAVFDGTILEAAPLPLSNIKLSVSGDNPNAREIFPWDEERCKPSAPRESLGGKCSMAFSTDFTTFSVRATEFLDTEAKISMEWPGLRGYFLSLNRDNIVDSLQSDSVLNVRVATSITVDNEGGSGFPAFKIGAIGGAVGFIVLVLAIGAWVAYRNRSVFDDDGYITDRRDKSSHISYNQTTLDPSTQVSDNRRQSRSQSRSQGRSTPRMSGNTSINTPVTPEFETNNNMSPFSVNSVKTVKVPVPKDTGEEVRADEWGNSIQKVVQAKKKIIGANKRFLQMDMLHGPASRGVCGPHGTPVNKKTSSKEGKATT